MANALYLGDRVIVNPYWPSEYPDTHWRGRVKELGRRSVLVEASDRSDDSLVENEMWCAFGALTREGT